EHWGDGLSVFIVLAAHLPTRHRQSEPQRTGFLQSTDGRTARQWHRAVRNSLSLGSPTGVAGQRRRMAITGHRESLADYAGYVGEKLSDRIRCFFTLNEVSAFVDLGYQTGIFAPGLKLSAANVNQVRHHAVLAHGLAVEAIRARAKPGTKVG